MSYDGRTIPWITAWLVVMIGCATSLGEEMILPPAGFIDESAFRQGLRQRGLDNWLEQYLVDTPPADQVDKALRWRETLLDKAKHSGLSLLQRRALIDQASKILSTLISEHPEHPARLRWQLELARDFMERSDPAVFDDLLLYELPGSRRESACELSDRAMQVLESLRRQIGQTWKGLESLDESAFEEISITGSLAGLESLDTRSVFLLAWARLYHALSADPQSGNQAESLAALLYDVTDRYGWTQPYKGPQQQRCSALVIAAISARRCGKFSEANKYARGIVAAYKQFKGSAIRKQLRRASLLAVLEQIRSLRDAGKFDQTFEAIEQAKKWVERSRGGDIKAALAIALVERSTLAGQSAGVAASPNLYKDQVLLQPAESLRPIMELMARSPADRDGIYAAIAPAVADDPVSETLTGDQLQLLAGATVANAIASQFKHDPKISSRLDKIIAVLPAKMDSSSSTLSAWQCGELLFLLARANYLAGKRLPAVRVLNNLVENFQAHDRALLAVRQATAIAQELLGKPGGRDLSAIRSAFIRAGRLLRALEPDSQAAGRLQYLIALALENNDQLQEAAQEYAAVGADDPNVLKSALGRIRCLRSMLIRAESDPTADQAKIHRLAESTLQAARESVSLLAIQQTAAVKQDRCIPADIVLCLANILNHQAIDKPTAVIDALKDFEKRFADCPEAIGTALRERVLAFRKLKQLREARLVVEQFLQADPQAAGPVMANLLQAMRDEINAAADRGDQPMVKALAGEAAELAKTLLEWAADNIERMTPKDRLTILIWRAWSLLQAESPSKALTLYKASQKEAKDLLPEQSSPHFEIELGRAECLLVLQQADEALPIFTDMWTRSPERSDYWWRAFVGSLRCHQKMGSDIKQIRQSIHQQRHLSPNLGGPRWKRILEAIEKDLVAQ